MIELSIVVLSWNTRELTLACLDSIARALGTPGAADAALAFEVIVVDNGSDDGTADAVRARFPWVDVVALPGNLGFSAGNNVGLRRARGPVALLLNSDTVVNRDAVVRCLAFLAAEPRAGVVGPQLLHPDGRLQNSVHSPPSLLTELVPKAVLEWCFPRRFPSKRRPSATPIPVEAVLGACMFVRREAWESAGLLPEREFFLFLEETDWCWSLRDAGWQVFHVPDARITHLSGGSSKKKVPARTRIEYHRALYRFFRKRRGEVAAASVVALRVTKGLVALVGRLPAALVSARGRERLAERWQVLAWHLRGCPAREGLVTDAYLAHVAALDASAGGGTSPASGAASDAATGAASDAAARSGAGGNSG
jgi:GT2 family glycosyltransferase